MRTALTAAGLPALVERIDEEQAWSQMLSGGEQQRLAIARALLLRPDWLFLDEATSSLDPAAEKSLYTALREQLPETTIISIAHRPDVTGYHDHVLNFQREPGQAGTLIGASARRDDGEHRRAVALELTGADAADGAECAMLPGRLAAISRSTLSWKMT